MMRRMFSTLVLAGLLAPAAATAQTPHDHGASLNERGKRFMGFDQEATTHHFVLLSDGGRIEVTAKKVTDSSSVRQIRDHLRHIAAVFAKGDFNLPALVHDNKAVPGVDAIKANAAALTFTFEEIEGGGHVRITGGTPPAAAAVHQFLRFQIKDHGTGDPVVVR